MKLLWLSVLLACNFIAPALKADTFLDAAKNHFVTPVDSSNVTFSYIGTSSFLIEAAGHQVLLDGFVSRPKHFLFGRFQPNSERIKKFLTDLNVCKSRFSKNRSGESELCQKSPQKHLDLAIAMHGHYDHALDTPFISAWAGSRMLTDKSLDRVIAATRNLETAQGREFNWDTAKFEDIGNYLGKDAKRLTAGDMVLKLVETPHGLNPISKHIRTETPKGFRFRSSIWRMGTGTNVSLSISHKNKTALIVASAGDIGDRLKTAGIDDVDVVFLSIGGLGRNSEVFREDYWTKAVTDTKAERVFLIHWDNHQKPLPKPGEEFSTLFFEKNEVTLKHFQDLAARENVQIKFAPPLVPFDPFFALPARK